MRPMYANTVIYKITCKNPTIHDVFVGHTTNFLQKQNAHKISCQGTSPTLMYKTLRLNGGWENWSMDILLKQKCENLAEVKKLEAQFVKELNAKLVMGRTPVPVPVPVPMPMPVPMPVPALAPVPAIAPATICAKCHKKFETRQGLWYHAKKNCDLPVTSDLLKGQEELKNVMLEFVKTNLLLQTQIMEMCRNQAPVTTINNNNRTFNLNFFLNEQCKNAMNLSDFVSSFKMQLSDLEQVGRLGFVEGMADVILRRVKDMDIYDRPFHCSDGRRVVMHVKDNDIWEKDSGDENSKIRHAVQILSNKNAKMLMEWRNTHPASTQINHAQNDQFMILVIEAMGGKGDKTENENKIMRQIAKEVLVGK